MDQKHPRTRVQLGCSSGSFGIHQSPARRGARPHIPTVHEQAVSLQQVLPGDHVVIKGAVGAQALRSGLGPARAGSPVL
eukprot:9443590-Pyramimonas_sp.AAC.1